MVYIRTNVGGQKHAAPSGIIAKYAPARTRNEPKTESVLELQFKKNIFATGTSI